MFSNRDGTDSCIFRGWAIPLFHGRSHFLQGQFLDLPDAFTSDAEFSANLPQGFWRFVIKTEAHHENCAFALVESFKYLPDQCSIGVPDELIEWGRRIRVGHGIEDRFRI